LNLVKISYIIHVFDSNNNTILPSDLTLYYNLRIICLLNINTINITSLAAIKSDKFFKCIEFFKLNEKIRVGYIIYGGKEQKKSILMDLDKYMNNYIPEKNDVFDVSKVKDEYKSLITQLENNNSIKTKKLKKLYISRPINSLKRSFSKHRGRWNFVNLFNEYFCFCLGSNTKKPIIY
jgi:hypothetical protein